jgi:SAM-dependent methyltransferase
VDPQWADWYDCYFGTYTDDIEFFVGEAEKTQGRVLEVGCGTGRLTIPMLERGVRVAGFDPLPEMLERLRKLAGDLDVDVDVSCQRIESFRYDKRFDLILAPFRVFNHCLDPASQRAALENCRRHLARGGRLVLATFVPDPELITSATSMIQYMATVVHPETKRAVICSQFNAEIDLLNQRRTDVWVFEELDRDQRVLRKVHLPLEIRWVYPSEMALLLELAGFDQFEIHGGFQRQPLDDTSSEQVWIASSTKNDL